MAGEDDMSRESSVERLLSSASSSEGRPDERERDGGGPNQFDSNVDVDDDDPTRALAAPLLPKEAQGSASSRGRYGGPETEIGSGEQDSSLVGLQRVNKMFVKAANLALATNVTLVALVFGLTPAEKREYLPPSERRAATVALAGLIVAFVLAMTRFLFVSSNASWRQHMGGIIYASLVTQSVAIMTNSLLAFAPSVVLVDPVTSSRVFMLRWCEWIPLSGLMTFLSEGVGMRKKSGVRSAVLISLSQSLSCVCGIVFPLCPGPISWGIWMFISMVTYLAMFERVYAKRKMYLAERNRAGSTFIDKEHLDRIRFAYQLIAVCSTVWTILVVAYFINMLLHWYLPPNHYLLQQDWSLAMFVDTCFDVIAKAIYMKLIVDVHFCVFDADGRAQRQLWELRNLMNVLWDSSSDAIVISARSGDKVTSLLSPSLLRLVDLPIPDRLAQRKGVALLIETERNCGIRSGENPQGEHAFEITSCTFIDCSGVPYGDLRGGSILGELSVSEIDGDGNKARGVTVQVSELVYAVWNHASRSTVESILMFHLSDRRCEIKVSPHTDDTLVAVIRDVTERFKRLEAERKAHLETVARQKDAQSQTRFVRHEVKNGLLAGIELCDSLRNAMDDLDRALEAVKSIFVPPPSSMRNIAAAAASTGATGTEDVAISDSAEIVSNMTDRPRRLMEELDVTLHEVLDTVLAEAMARDVTHEVYQPRKERLDVLCLFHNFGSKLDREERFPVVVVGPQIPYLMLDSQLLRYVHRNAISNACKYGEQGGTVLTELSYDITTEMFRIAVKNRPGLGHDTLLALGESATELVFAQGSMLHTDVNNQANYISSGDGAWIMQKCAKTMGGVCHIEFRPSETTFTFTCPAEPLRAVELPDTEDFQVPPDTWGIAVDDSRIQRKLMGRILEHIGVAEENRIVLGATSTEVNELETILRTVMAKKPPSSKVLVLVDENLDFCECDGEPVVLSGSLIMMDFLSTLSAAEEEDLFVLVRSANDSTDDVALYTIRCHGFFPKAPMQKQRIQELLAPLWADRFFHHPVAPRY